MFDGKIATGVAGVLGLLWFDRLWGALQRATAKTSKVSWPGENFWTRGMTTSPRKSAAKLPMSW